MYIRYRLAWARTYLKGLGLLTNSQRGVWTVTEAGQAITSKDQVSALRAEYNAAYARNRARRKDGAAFSCRRTHSLCW